MNRRRFLTAAVSLSALAVVPPVALALAEELPNRNDVFVLSPEREWVLYPEGLRGLKRGQIFYMAFADNSCNRRFERELGYEFIGTMVTLGGEGGFCFAVATEDGQPDAGPGRHPQAGVVEANWFATFEEAESHAEQYRPCVLCGQVESLAAGGEGIFARTPCVLCGRLAEPAILNNGGADVGWVDKTPDEILADVRQAMSEMARVGRWV